MENMDISKILILGNSITRHLPKTEIGWTADCGMAASSLEKDYSHLLLQYFAATNNNLELKSEIKNIADFEREYAVYDIVAELKPYEAFNPDVVILAIGENIPLPQTEEARQNLIAALNKLLSWIRKNGNPAIFVRSCFWADSVKDEILRQVCTAAGGTFVDIGMLHKDEANFARSEREFANAGVANHPGDKGMAAIADALWQVIVKTI